MESSAALGKGLSKESASNFKLDNSAGASIQAASKLNITKVLTVNAGTLATNDSLVLSSDSTVTARVASIPASGAAISGNVKVIQYVQGGLRRYRFWSHPFINYIGLNQLQNFIDITGVGGSSNGFTSTGSNSPSAFRYNPFVGNDSMPSDPGWRPFTNIGTSADSNRLHRHQGIRVFFRGAKGQGLGYVPYTPSSVVVAQMGALNQGTQNVTMEKGTSAHQDYNMLGNPYASPVDIGTVVTNAKIAGLVAGAAYYVWNPTMGTAGQFQAKIINTTTPVPFYLPANCAFQVRTTTNGNSLTFTESNKGTTVSANLLKVNTDSTTLVIYDTTYHPWDVLQLGFNDGASAKEDDADATKPTGADFNFCSRSADNQKLAVDTRPFLANATIPLSISGTSAREFVIKAENITVPANGKLYLHDRLLEQYILLQPGIEYRFAVTENKNTYGDNRLELAMRPAGETIAATKDLTFNLYPNPAVDEVGVSFSMLNAAPVKLKITDIAGTVVYSTNLVAQQTGTHIIKTGNLAAGVYMVEMTSGAEKVVKKLVKE